MEVLITTLPDFHSGTNEWRTRAANRNGDASHMFLAAVLPKIEVAFQRAYEKC